MTSEPFGRIIRGNVEEIRRAHDAFSRQPVDWDLSAEPAPAYPAKQRTIARAVTVSGPGTFFGRATRTITFEPSAREGWWFDRSDLEDVLPIRVSIRNVWTTGQIVSNIVLRSGPPQNYVRMVEHIIALRLGLGIDNLMIRIDSGDPPLSNRGSMDLVEALESAGIVEIPHPAKWLTVKEKVTIGGPDNFLILSPCAPGRPELRVDCAIDFPTFIGRQRLRFTLNCDRFRYAADARTNTSYAKKLYCQTIGKLFADVRNLGYTHENILIAARNRYVNEPRHLHEGKALEAAWHRSMLDLLAALALAEEGRFVGGVVSYKAGHNLDCQLMRQLYRNDLLMEM